MSERIERKRKILKLTGEQILKRLEALKLKENSGELTPEEKTEQKALKKRAEQMLEHINKVLDRCTRS